MRLERHAVALLAAAGCLIGAGVGVPAAGAAGVQVSAGNHATEPRAGAPATAVTRNGVQLVVWSAAVEEGGNYRLWGRLVTTGGAPAGEVFEISPPQGAEPIDAVGAALAVRGRREEFLVVWTQNPEDGDIGEGNEIVARRLDARGQFLAEMFVVTSADSLRAPFGPSVVWGTRRHEFLVAWSEQRATGEHEVYAARLPAGGSEPRATSRISITGRDGVSGGSSPTLAYDSRRGRYLAAWDAYIGDGSLSAVYARIVPPGPKQRLGRPRRLSGYRSPMGDFVEPAVAYNRRRREFVVSWTAGELEESAIFARRVTVDARPRGPEVEIYGSSFGSFGSDIEAAASGRYLVAFGAGGLSGSEPAILARRLSPRLRERSTFAVSSAGATRARSVAVAYSKRAKRFRLAWAEAHGPPGPDFAAPPPQHPYEIFAAGF